MRPLSPQQLTDALNNSERELAAGQAAAVRAAMLGLLQLHPKSGKAHRLLGLASQRLGDPQMAEAALRDAADYERRDPTTLADLGGFYASQDRPREAEKAYRAALALNRLHEGAAAGLARLMLRLGRNKEALQLTTPLVAGPRAGEDAFSAHGQALRALGRDSEATDFLTRAATANPASPYARYRLAGVHSDMGRHSEAEAELRATMERGYDNAEVRVALAHVLQDQDRFDDAEAAYRSAVEIQPDHLGAHADLAELIWMRSGDKGQALAPLDAALAERPTDWSLLFGKWRVLTNAGDKAGAFEAIKAAVELFPAGAVLQTTAARAAGNLGEADKALEYAKAAFAIDPVDSGVRGVLAQAFLGVGDAKAASEVIGSLLAERPDDQFGLAVQAVCWRLLGDDRYAELYDYDRLVKVTELAAPKGWKSVEAYLEDLKPALTALHAFKAHPFGQSVRGGSQAVLRHAQDPTVRAIHEAIGPPIDEWVAGMGKGPDPVRRRNTGKWALNGIWSVRLFSAGFHDDHVHPGGWLSSACYIDLPPIGDEESHAGWLKFGEPGGLTTVPPLVAEKFVEPKPGRLVLFPSYMWHGTVPFTADESRLSVAFDVVPG